MGIENMGIENKTTSSRVLKEVRPESRPNLLADRTALRSVANIRLDLVQVRPVMICKLWKWGNDHDSHMGVATSRESKLGVASGRKIN